MSILHTEQGRIAESIARCKKAQVLQADFAEPYNDLARAGLKGEDDDERKRL